MKKSKKMKISLNRSKKISFQICNLARIITESNCGLKIRNLERIEAKSIIKIDDMD
jgi:hypothetical protein